MYSGYATTALTLRAKSSLYARLPIGDDQRCCRHSHYHHHQSLCCCSCNYNISYGLPVNPRLLSTYLFAQSRRINWTPRRFLLAAAAYRRIGSFWDSIDSLANIQLAHSQVTWVENVEFKRKNKKKKKKRDCSSEELPSDSSEDLPSDYEVENGRRRRSGIESKCRCSCRGDEYEKERSVRKSRRGGSGGACSSRRGYEYDVRNGEENEDDFEDSGRDNGDHAQTERSYQDVHRRRDRAGGERENYRWQRGSRDGSKKDIRISEVHEDDWRVGSKLRDYDEEAREVYTRRYNGGRASKSRGYDEDGREGYTRRDDRGRASKSRAYDEELREGYTRRDDRGRPSKFRDYKEEVTENYTRRDDGGTASNYNEAMRENYRKGDNRGRASMLIDYNEEVREDYARRDDRGRASKLGDYNEDVGENYTRRDEKERPLKLRDCYKEVREDYTKRDDRGRASKFEDIDDHMAGNYGQSDSRRTTRTSEIHEDYRDSGSWRRDSDHVATEEPADEQLGSNQKVSWEGSQKVIWKSEVDGRKIASRLKGSAQSEKDVYVNEERVNLAKRDSEDVSNRSARTAEVREAHKKMIASASNLVNSTMVNKEECSASTASRIRDHQTTEHASSSQNRTNLSEISDSYIKRASLSHMKFDETRLNDREETSVEVTRDRRTRLNIKEVENIDINLQSKARANLSSICSTDIQNQNTNEYDQKHHASTVKEHSEREELNQTSGQLVERSSIIKADRNRPMFQLPKSNTGRISTYQETASSTSEETTNKKVESQEKCSSPVQPKFSRSTTDRTLNSQEPINSNVEIKEDMSLARDDNENTVKASMVNGNTSQLGELQIDRRGNLNGGSGPLNRSRSEEDNERSEDNINQIGDILESARRSEKSSAQHVEEFVKKLQLELSTSDDLSNPSEQYPGTLVKETDEGETSQSSRMGIAGLAGTPEFKDGISIQDSERQSSSMSEPEGPSEEMWIAKSVSSEERAQREALEEEHSPDKDSTNVSEGTETAIARRGPKSLWAYIAQVIRMSWQTSGGTRSPGPLSGGRSSSIESLDSEAWFSGNELDDNEVTDKGRKVMSQQAGLSKSKSEPTTKIGLEAGGRDSMEELLEGRTSALASFRRKGSTSGPIALSNEVVPLEADVATSMSSGKSGPSFGSASPVTGSDNVNLSEIERDQQVIHAGVETVGHSDLLTGTASSASAPETITEIETPGSASEKLKAGELPDISGHDAKLGELKQKQFEKSKQVMRQQFDEWEEAYKQESQRQKLDEFFMREALLEAKKAADMWEVPVGAVLVQNGKIIARGCNMVEELRDSTAHAEMICIREASNLLRTWRLADTTLYVTLEPCPMCAGAILQARIDTVVWGAPNKLLGADGSWVRLFPGDDGSGLDSPNRTVGPVHPFHTKITIRRGVLSNECANAMQRFFQLRRKKDKKPDPSTPTCLPLATHRPKFFTRMHNMFGLMFCL